MSLFLATSGMALSVLPLSGTALSMLPLLPCDEAGRAGRAGLCAGGEPIALRGANYIRLDPIDRYHNTFSPSGYNRTRNDGALAHLKARGFNVARVFVDGRSELGIAGKASSTNPVDANYIEHLREFVSDAAAHNIYTMITLERLPENEYFASILRQAPTDDFGPENIDFMSTAGVAAWHAYAAAVSAGLRERLPQPLHSSIIFSLQNEFSLLGDERPFNSTIGLVHTAAGAFDMGSATSRQQAADANLLAWAEASCASLRTWLPHALVTVGMFTFAAVNKTGPNGLNLTACANGGDCRFPARPALLSKSSLDFLDVHIYQPSGTADALAANLRTEEWDDVHKDMPIMMGEFGCFRNSSTGGGWYPSAAACAPHVQELQITSCKFGFTGWLFWTFDTDDELEQPSWFSMVDDDGAIEAVLAPRIHRDPCMSRDMSRFQS